MDTNGDLARLARLVEDARERQRVQAAETAFLEDTLLRAQEWHAAQIPRKPECCRAGCTRERHTTSTGKTRSRCRACEVEASVNSHRKLLLSMRSSEKPL
jgi:hypothetical protein